MKRIIHSIIFFIGFVYSNCFAEPWIQKSDFGGTGRHRAVGISIANKGYIGLGHVNGTGIDIDYNDWWQFDPASNSWTQKANYPVYNHGAVAFSTATKGYVGGGSALNGEFYQYNPQTNTWTAITNCPVSPGDTPAFSIENKGYVFSGSMLYEYNPFSNLWVQKANCPGNVSAWSSSFSNETSGFLKVGAFLYEYKPSMNTWVNRAGFPGSMTSGGCAFEKDNKGYFVCGYVGSLSIVTNEVWEYNPANNNWNLMGEFPATSRRFPVGFSINGKGYFGTGTNGINMNDFWEFDFDPLAIDEIVLKNLKVNTFPNPSYDQINFQFQGIDSQKLNNYTLNIFDCQGRKLISRQVSNNEISIKKENLDKGVYVYSIEHFDTSIFTGKILFN